MILTGRFGKVLWDPAVASPLAPVEIVSLNAWKASLKKDYDEVTCFGDTNKVWVPGLPDVSGSIGGFWNSAELALMTATAASSPGWLRLEPNSNESSFLLEGLAYLDADIDCSLKVPKITGTFKAAGPWTLPH